jgi:hypothetical protein
MICSTGRCWLAFDNDVEVAADEAMVDYERRMEGQQGRRPGGIMRRLWKVAAALRDDRVKQKRLTVFYRVVLKRCRYLFAVR